MNDPRWFKLLIRAIGVLTLALSVPRLGDIISVIGRLVAQGPSGWTFYTPYATTTRQANWFSPEMFATIVALIADLTQLVLGSYLLFGAPRLVQFCIRQVGGRCPACDYDIRGLKGACPECGVPIAAQPAPSQI